MELNKYIDHTLLKQGMTLAEVYKLYDEAVENNFAAICIPSSYLEAAFTYSRSHKSDVKLCTVIGFPFGYNTLDSKCEEIREAVFSKADEIDIVQNVSLVKNGDWDKLAYEIKMCLNINEFYVNIKPAPIVKVILETGLLSEEEIIKCCQIYSKFDKIDFIKTSTGFAAEPLTGEAFKEDKINTIKLIKANIPETMQIKASGGIRDLDFALKLIEAGATRLGCSSGVKLMQELAGEINFKEVTGNY